jgi:hypothetical protein
VTVAPLEPSQTLANRISNKLLADLTLTFGSVLLLTMTFSIIYMLSSINATIDFNILEYIYVLIMPVSFNLFSILFYADNVIARQILLREFIDSCYTLIEWNQ